MRQYAIERGADGMPVRMSWAPEIGAPGAAEKSNVFARRPRKAQQNSSRTGAPRAAEQLPLLEPTAPVDVPVYLACPSCRYAWLSAILVPGAWWAAGQTPEKVAKVPYCPQCHQAPPMVVANQ